MSMQEIAQEQRKNSQVCLDILMQCKTGKQTIAALHQIARILRAAEDPVAEAAEQAFQLSQSMDEATVLKVRDDFIEQFRDFLAATESLATTPTGRIAQEKLGPMAESAKPKDKRVWLIAGCGIFIAAIALVAIAAVVFMLVGGS
jgi:hypothetical protein